MLPHRAKIAQRLAHVLFAGLISFSCSAIANNTIEPLPENVAVNYAKVELGEKLFNDTILSADNSVACASCHDLTNWGAEPTAVSTGVLDQLGNRNSPTVFNAAFNFKQFWDGRADTLKHQAESPVVNPVEMGMASWDKVVTRLKKTNYYNNTFRRIYGEISTDTVVDAIAEFEKTLILPNSPFDKYLRGDTSAITSNQKRGYELFQLYGCVACHQGKNVGGNMFQTFGVMEEIADSNSSLSSDLGRYTITGNELDKHVFKVPSLRLATKTAPYFHDGSIATIEEAVDIMIRFQLGRNVPDTDRDSIIDFLDSLVGEKPTSIN